MILCCLAGKKYESDSSLPDDIMVYARFSYSLYGEKCMRSKVPCGPVVCLWLSQGSTDSPELTSSRSEYFRSSSLYELSSQRVLRPYGSIQAMLIDMKQDVSRLSFGLMSDAVR